MVNFCSELSSIVSGALKYGWTSFVDSEQLLVKRRVKIKKSLKIILFEVYKKTTGNEIFHFDLESFTKV